MYRVCDGFKNLRKMDSSETASTSSEQCDDTTEHSSPKPSTSADKYELRENFLTRVRNSGHRCYEKIRKILDKAGDNISKKTIHELENILIEANETYLFEYDEVTYFFEYLKREVAEREAGTEAEQAGIAAEQAGTSAEQRIEMERFSTQCAACGGPLFGENLCEFCLTVVGEPPENIF